MVCSARNRGSGTSSRCAHGSFFPTSHQDVGACDDGIHVAPTPARAISSKRRKMPFTEHLDGGVDRFDAGDPGPDRRR